MPEQTVSILMPTYKPDPVFLKAAIDCVLNQSYPHWTLYIHDDASEADVQTMVEPFLKDERIRFARSAKRLGIGGNWNACLREAKGTFVQYLFQDDLWYRDYLQENVEIMKKNPTIGMTAAHHAYKGEQQKDTKAFFEKAGFDAIQTFKKEHLQEGPHNGKEFLLWWLKRGLRPNVIGEPSFVLMRKKTMDTVGLFREDMKQGLDLEYWVRMLLATDWYYLGKELGAFRVHKAGTSMQNDMHGQGLFDRLLCLEVALHNLQSGPAKKEAKRALAEQLESMAARFKTRQKEGGKVAGGGSRFLVRFALRHPFLCTYSIAKGLLKRQKKPTA